MEIKQKKTEVKKMEQTTDKHSNIDEPQKH